MIQKGFFRFSLAAAAVVTPWVLQVLFRWKNSIDFEDKVVLITGSSRGLGLILAKRFALEGAHVVLCARNEKELMRAQAQIESLGGRVSSYVCDVADPSQIDQMVHQIIQTLGRVDILVNNASIIQVGPALAMTAKDYQDAMNVNYWGTVYATRAVVPSMMRHRWGRIVNITSIGGVVPVPHLLPYVAAKFASRGFSEGLGAELDAYGIRVTTVVPGLMRTGSFINAFFKGNQEEEFNWFTLGATLPWVSMDAERAAARVIEAVRNGEVRVTVGKSAQMLQLIYRAFPIPTLALLRAVNRILPGPTERSPGHRLRPRMARVGKSIQSRILNSPLTYLGKQAIQKFNEGDEWERRR